jgi:glycerophosphoryl diester phosphodiesterase
MRQLWERPVAHRGLHGPGRPENSLPAVEAARRLGLPLEIDVRVTADGVAVVHHDASLLRMCGVPHRIADLPLSQVTPLRLNGTEHTSPTLEHVLDLIGTDIPVLIDCKVLPTRRDRTRMLTAVLRDVKQHPGLVGVVGFDPWLFAQLRDAAPDVLRGQSAGVSSYESRFPRLVSCIGSPLDRFWLNGVSRPDFLTYNVDRLPQPALSRLRETGLPVLGWTVRRAAQLADLEGVVDNVIAEGEAMDQLLAATAVST